VPVLAPGCSAQRDARFRRRARAMSGVRSVVLSRNRRAVR
jgi:hypothetical protein